MARSTKQSWLEGPGDLREADVEDVPVPGESIRVRGLPAKYSAQVQSQLKLEQDGGGQIARIDVASMERLQFAHGVIEPQFTEDEAGQIQEKYGPAFRKAIAQIDELSGIDKEAIKEVEQRFPAGGDVPEGDSVGNGAAAGDDRSDLSVRAG